MADDKPAGKGQPDHSTHTRRGGACARAGRQARHPMYAHPGRRLPLRLAGRAPATAGWRHRALSQPAGRAPALPGGGPAASLVVAPAINDQHALAKPRVTLVGRAEVVEDRTEFADTYAALHPDARGYINFPDFQFYRLHVERVRYIAGFGQMGWIKGEAYRERSQREAEVLH